MNLNNTIMTKIGGIACSILLTTGLFAQQNLVNNGGFEDVKGKVKRPGSIAMANGWTSATGVKADLFVDTKEPGFSTPDNLYGTENAKDGANYAGIVAFSYGDKMPRTYLQTRLTTPLKKGQKYCISYHVSLAEGSKYAVNQLGFHFSKKEYETDSKASLIEDAQYKDAKIHNALFGWDKICDTYMAEGNEKFLVLGNFNSNEDIKQEKNRPTKGLKVEQLIAAYYYIDDVSVVLIEDDVTCECGNPDEETKYSTLIYQKQIYLDEAKNTPKQMIEGQELYFGFGDDRLTIIAKGALDVIAKQMLSNPNMKLQINGHSDEMEDKVGEEKEQYADMDNKRIAAVIEYLTSKEIAESRLIASAQGSDSPNSEISENDDEDVAQAKNRRVLFVVR
jgi:outer membrane protein OmpA-like peptidoglycan-associated protein